MAIINKNKNTSFESSYTNPFGIGFGFGNIFNKIIPSGNSDIKNQSSDMYQTSTDKDNATIKSGWLDYGQDIIENKQQYDNSKSFIDNSQMSVSPQNTYSPQLIFNSPFASTSGAMQNTSPSNKPSTELSKEFGDTGSTNSSSLLPILLIGALAGGVYLLTKTPQGKTAKKILNRGKK